VTVAVAAAERRCPRCDSPAAEAQEYCLECGLRLPASKGVLAALGSGWRHRLGWYPGDWVWPALLALVIAGGAGVVSALWLADTSSSASQTIVATSPAASSVELTASAPEPTVTTTQQLPTAPGTTGAQPPRPAPSAGRVVSWPAGRSAWTIVLNSLPTTNGRVGPLAQARQASRLGLKQVGVLDSGHYSSLHPGYYVIFAGIYDTQAEAQSDLIDAHRHGYRGAYPRRITP
jgi:hypothetical protein